MHLLLMGLGGFLMKKYGKQNTMRKQVTIVRIFCGLAMVAMVAFLLTQTAAGAGRGHQLSHGPTLNTSLGNQIGDTGGIKSAEAKTSAKTKPLKAKKIAIIHDNTLY